MTEPMTPSPEDLVDFGIEALDAEADDLKTMLLKTNRNFARFTRLVKRQRRVNIAFITTFVIDGLVTLISLLALITANNNRDDLKEQVVIECERSNTQGQANIDLWTDTIAKADPNNNPNATAEDIAEWNDPEAVAFREAFINDINEQFAPEDC